MTDEKQQNATAKRDRGIRLTVLAIFSVAIILVGGFFYSFTRARVMTTEELKSQGAYPVSYTHLTLPTNREV